MIRKDKWMFGIQIATLFCVGLSWLIVPFFTEVWRKRAEVAIWQHTAMSDAHRNLVTALYELEQYADELISKHNCEPDDLPYKMSAEEFNEASRLNHQVNIELAIMYMIMPDNKYEVIPAAIDSETTTSLKIQREALLRAMRKSQFPDTRFGGPGHIRYLHGLKRPEKQVENKQ